MKMRNMENRLALVGALIVLIGVSAAASTAFAKDTSDATASAKSRSQNANSTVLIARQAMKDAADEAAAALEVENAFDLDNQLADIRSTLVASRK